MYINHKSAQTNYHKLLNISLPYSSPILEINSAALPILPISQPLTTLPRIHAPQILLDTSDTHITSLIDSNQLNSPGAPSLGLSYTFSTQRLESSTTAILFTFDIFETYSSLFSPALTTPLSSPQQQTLQLILLQRPLISAGDAPQVYQIIRAELTSRPSSSPKVIHKAPFLFTSPSLSPSSYQTTSNPFIYILNILPTPLLTYISSGAWALFAFIISVIALFVVLCLFCIFACGKGEYEAAQRGKRRRSGRGSWSGNAAGDVEKGNRDGIGFAKGRFLSAEELGLRGGGRLVGVGKSD